MSPPAGPVAHTLTKHVAKLTELPSRARERLQRWESKRFVKGRGYREAQIVEDKYRWDKYGSLIWSSRMSNDVFPQYTYDIFGLNRRRRTVQERTAEQQGRGQDSAGDGSHGGWRWLPTGDCRLVTAGSADRLICRSLEHPAFIPACCRLRHILFLRSGEEASQKRPHFHTWVNDEGKIGRIPGTTVCFHNGMVEKRINSCDHKCG